MSQYLSNFYCGNSRGLCNYQEPIDYQKLLNRNFDSNLHKILEDCKGKEFEKGYCCDSTNKELQKPMDDEYMEQLNKKFEANIFSKDRSGNFHSGQIPLIKPLTKDGKLEAMEVCTCGGDPQTYADCVSENCRDYRKPTRYEYCKIGHDLNNPFCVVEPAPAGSEEENKHVQERCKLQPVDKEKQFTHSHNFKINNLQPDCYLNMCVKESQLQVLDQLISSTTTDEHKYYKLGDTLENYNFKKNEKQLEKEYQETVVEDKSLLKYFGLN